MKFDRQLTERQTRFIREYLVDGNGTRAAVAAGYGRAGARVTACRTLMNPNVKAVLEARRAEDVVRLGVDRDRVVAELLEAAAMAKEQCNIAGMIAAWREIGKMCGYYAAHRTAVTIDTRQPSAPNPYESMSDKQLVAIVNAVGG